MSRLLLRWLYSALLVVLIAGCSGGGCSGCAGGAITPIPGGFALTPERRIPHAMQLRLTSQGLHSIEAMAPDLFAGFLGSGINVPMSTGTMSGFSYTICSAPPCTLTVQLSTTPPPMELTFVAPDQINAKIRIIAFGDIPIRGCPDLGCSAGCTGTFCVRTTPTIRVDTRRGSRAFIGLSTNIAMVRDMHAPRSHYMRADFVSPTGSGEAIQETMGEEIQTDDITCVDSALCFIVNLLRSTIIGQFRNQFAAALGPIQEALAASSAPPGGCPTGTTVDGTHCRYSDMSLVPLMLGTDGTGNFGSLVGGITPGVRALDSFVIAAGDHDHNAEATATGMTINTFGTFVSTQHNSCVPRLPAPGIPTIPEWMNLRQNNVPGTTTTIDLGVGVAEEFLNNMMWNFWDSGLFCLGVNTRLSQSLSTGMFTALPQLASLRPVIFPLRNSPMAMVLRPQQPPTITIGRGTDIATNPLMRVRFTRLAIDFYAWSEERYVRFMTVTTDLEIPVNLMQDAMGLRPVLGTVRTAMTTVTNSGLLTVMPAQLVGVLDTLLGTAIGMFAGSLPTIALPSIPVPGAGGMPVGNVNILVPTGGVQGVTEGTSRYLGLFANLQYRRTGAMPDTIEIDTTAEMERLPFNASVYDFRDDFSADQLPSIRLRLGTVNDFARQIEYTYRVDEMTWSNWTRETVIDVRSPSFINQGSHKIEVRSRVVDRPETTDREPVRVDFTIDTRAPTVQIARTGDRLVATASDAVSASEGLRYNFSFDGAQSTEWGTSEIANIPPGAHDYVVRVRDESGNETRATGSTETLIIRGGPSTDASSCGCSTPGSTRSNTMGLAAVLAAMAGVMFLTRRRAQRLQARVSARVASRSPRRGRGRGPNAFIMWSIVIGSFAALGCDCSATIGGDAGTDARRTCDGGQRFCASMNRCATGAASCDRACERGQMPTATARFNETTCTWDTSPTACGCEDFPPLSQGMAGSHLDMAVHTDNTVWLSAYSAGDAIGQAPYGDLIVGRWDAALMRATWTHVDGVPTDAEPTGQIGGWRGGIAEPGNDVGRWNSIRLDPMGRPRVAYWDTTNDKLKFAAFDGTRWAVHTVDMAGRNGRYASLVMLPGGIPAIAYRQTIIDPMMAGRVLARVRYARANNATPAAPADWTIVDVASATTSCRAADCATGTACVQATGLCAPVVTGCPAACPAAQACIARACTDIYTPGWVEDFPPGIGLFNSLALDSTGRPQLVYYDRDRGNLMGARVATGTAFSPAFILDGEAAMRDGGDRGAWASLTVAADGTWHVAYVDAYEEKIMYLRALNGVVMGTREVVDDGNGIGMTAFDDGHHIIGDSASISLDAMGVVRVAYQDSTVGALRMSTRGTGTTATWTVSTPDMVNHTGYWARIRGGQMATFFRDMAMRRYGVRVTAVR